MGKGGVEDIGWKGGRGLKVNFVVKLFLAGLLQYLAIMAFVELAAEDLKKEV